MVEVLHAFPHTMIGSEQHQHTHSSPHRATPIRRPSEASASTSTIRPVHRQEDDTMIDVMAAPPRPLRHPATSWSASQSGTHELALHGSSDRIPPSPRLKSNPSVQASPVHVHAHAAMVANRSLQSSSVTSSVPNSPDRSMNTQSTRSHLSPPSPPRIKVKSLSHIQSFVIDDSNPLSPSRSSSRMSATGRQEISPQYEISEMPVAEIIEMVAGLLTKITTTNDRQHEYLHRPNQANDGQHSMSQQTTSVLAFHGKNIPSISILSYLSRIHKYCPTTYEVFLSLLVYFDRMTERVNSGPVTSLKQLDQESRARHAATLAAAADDGLKHGGMVPEAHKFNHHHHHSTQHSTPPSSGSLGQPQDVVGRMAAQGMPLSPPMPPLDVEQANLSHFFVVDSFNIHRLVIAGVTCASKFFSDIFYTNSRYAKVSSLANY
jgi:hypothetical protein